MTGEPARHEAGPEYRGGTRFGALRKAVRGEVAVPLLAVALFTLTVRGAFVVGLVGSDDVRYIDAASKLAAGLPAGVIDDAYGRAALIGWLALGVKLGVAPSSLWAAQLLTEVLLGLALFWFGCQFVDRRSATWASLCWALFPVGLVYGGIVVPDQFGLLLSLIGATLTIGALRSASAPPVAIVTAGAALGFAVSAKEPFALVLPILGAWRLLSSNRRGRDLGVLVVVGLVAVAAFALEYPFFRLWTGDWLYHHHVLAAAYGAGGWADSAFSLNATSVAYYLSNVILDPSVVGLMGWAGVAAMLGLKGKIRDRSLLLTWAIVFFLYLQFGTSDLTHYDPVPKQPRYVEPIFVVLCVPLGALLRTLGGSDVLGFRGVLLLICGLSWQSSSLATQRLADPLYFADIPRAFAAASALAPNPDALVIPDWLDPHLPPDQRRIGIHADSAEVCSRLERAPTRAGTYAMILLPEGWSDGGHGCRISPAWDLRELHWPVTLLDRVLLQSGVSVLERRSLTRHVGELAVPSTVLGTTD